jgi:hypothetical protein
MPIPEDFSPTEEMISAAMEKHRITRAEVLFRSEVFVDWAISKGHRYADWNATWRNMHTWSRWTNTLSGQPTNKNGNSNGTYSGKRTAREMVAEARRRLDLEKAGMDPSTDIIEATYQEERQ